MRSIRTLGRFAAATGQQWSSAIDFFGALAPGLLMTSNQHGSALKALLADYQELPEYLGMVLSDVNQRSSFGDFPLSVAAVRGDVAAIQTLHAAGARLNAKGDHGYTALHSAVEQGNRDAVDCLLALGADRTIRTDKGLTPLDLADLLDEPTIADRLKTAS